MKISCGLANEDYKYVYGVNSRFTVPFKEENKLELICAGNDSAALQLLLYSEDEMVVCVNKDAYFSEKGPVNILRVEADGCGMGNADMELKLIGLVEDDDRQEKSDILLDQQYIYVAPRKVQAVWIEIKTGRGAHPGTYRPQINIYGRRMFEDEQLLRTLLFELKVVAAVLDDPRDYGFYLDLWQHNSNIARKYDQELWSDRHFEIMENYIAALAELGQKAITAVVSEIPWSGQFSCYVSNYPSNLFEYNMVAVAVTQTGEWKYDFSALNRYISLCMRYGIKEEIEVLGLINIWLLKDAGYGGIIGDYPDGIRIRYFDERDKLYKFIRTKQDLLSYIRALEKNFTDHGWIDKVRVAADEPADTALFAQRLNELRKAAPSFRYKAAINHISFMEQEIEGMTDYVPILQCFCKEPEKALALKEKIKGRLLYYVCCHPDFPNTFISSPLVEARVISWLAWYFGLDGFLRWNFTVWPENPLERMSYNYPAWKAGDTNFVYPGKDGRPLLTLRYKALRKGIRDFEIFKRYAEKSGSRVKIFEKLKTVFYWKSPLELHPESRKTSSELYSLCYDDYEAIIGEILEEL